MKTFNDILSLLNNDEKQLLADTINHGIWGDCEMEFANEDGTTSTVYCNGYCTNDAKNGGHFSGRKLSAMFSAMYKKLETIHYPQSGMGEITCHCNDWWNDGSGDMLFIRDPFDKEAEEWARNYKPEAEEPAKEEKTKETVFETILKRMSLDEKATVMHNLYEVEKLFKEYVEADGGKWIDVMCDDEALRNIFIGSSLASQLWFNQHKEQEQANQ